MSRYSREKEVDLLQDIKTLIKEGDPIMPVTYYRITYFDDENKRFGVSDEIVSSEDEATNRTCALKERGYQVRISNTKPVKDKSEVPSVQEIVLLFQGKYTYDPELRW